jgi:hypothetical protein
MVLMHFSRLAAVCATSCLLLAACSSFPPAVAQNAPEIRVYFEEGLLDYLGKDQGVYFTLELDERSGPSALLGTRLPVPSGLRSAQDVAAYLTKSVGVDVTVDPQNGQILHVVEKSLPSGGDNPMETRIDLRFEGTRSDLIKSLEDKSNGLVRSPTTAVVGEQVRDSVTRVTIDAHAHSVRTILCEGVPPQSYRPSGGVLWVASARKVEGGTIFFVKFRGQMKAGAPTTSPSTRPTE